MYFLGFSPLWIDESISAIASKAILAKGIPMLDSGVIILALLIIGGIAALVIYHGRNNQNKAISRYLNSIKR